MTDQRSTIHSRARNDDDDDQLLDVEAASTHGQKGISSDIVDEPIIDINSPDDEDFDTEPLLNKDQVRTPTTGISKCCNPPARYVIAVWAFLGYCCLYAMRVNLSVAIVAMVRILMK